MQKTKSLEGRIRIDYEFFIQSSENQRVKMFIDGLVIMLQKTINFNTTEFDKEKLIKDIELITPI